MKETWLFEDQLADVQPVTVVGSAFLTEHQQSVLLTLPASGVNAVTLPPISRCKGKFFGLRVDAAADEEPGTVLVQDQDDGAINYARTLYAVGDGVLMFCDGLQWCPVYEYITEPPSMAAETVVTEATTLTRDDTVVHVTLPATGTFDVTLAPVADCAGLTIAIMAKAVAAEWTDGVAVIEDQEDSWVDWTATLAALKDRVLLYCDGRQWFPLYVDVTA